MKKLIALILILVVTSFIVISKDDMTLEQRIETEKSRNPNSKNRNWEYVKDRLFDGETEKVYKLEGPILIDLSNATRQDSLVVNEIVNEFRTILPDKTIDYFKNFVGKSFEDIESNDNRKNFKGFDLHALLGSTIKIKFKSKIPEGNAYIKTRIDDNNEIARTQITKYEGYNHNYLSIIFNFDEAISFKKRKQYIYYEFFRTLSYINPAKIYAINPADMGVFNTPDYVPDQAQFNELDKFLLKKLYSDDFVDQFKDYMYANYPWRYASSFINKKLHEYKVWGIIIGIGIVVFILIFSYFQGRKYKYSYLNYLFPTFLIFLHLINFINIYDYLTKFNRVISWDNRFEFQIIVAILVSLLVSFLLWGLEKISFKENENFTYQMILKVIFTFVAFTTPLTLILLKSDRKGFLIFILPYVFFSIALALGRGLLLYLNHFSASLVKEKDLELSRLQEAKAEAEVKVLQSQINPHFLYNALNSIASLAHTDADKTEKMALSLSDLFRHSINRKGAKVNTLGDELSLVQNYLEIEQIRFGDRLDFSIDVEPDLLKVEIPMFILQPLVENAIKHGVSKIEGQGKIVLKVSKKDDGVLISVQDNGPDFPEGLVSGHGLQTVYDLLKLSYGDKVTISWRNEPQKEIMIQINAIL